NELDFFVFRVDIFMRERDAVVPGLQLLRDQQVIFGLEEVRAIVNRELEIVTVCDRVFRTRLDAETAEDATTVIDVVHRGITLVDTDAFGWRARIISSDDVDTFRRTRS